MAQPCCVKCGNRTFELQDVNPTRTNYKYNAITCTSCGGIAGVVEAYYLTVLLHKIFDHLGIPH